MRRWRREIMWQEWIACLIKCVEKGLLDEKYFINTTLVLFVQVLERLKGNCRNLAYAYFTLFLWVKIQTRCGFQRFCTRHFLQKKKKKIRCKLLRYLMLFKCQTCPWYSQKISLFKATHLKEEWCILCWRYTENLFSVFSLFTGTSDKATSGSAQS